MTSSVAAVRPDAPSSPATPYTEADWTDGDDTSRTPYVRSKTLAEQAAWEHVRGAGAEDRLATINPGAIIGPALNDDHSYSLQAIQRLLNGMPAAPRLGFTFVDVRDVADLHIRAMTEPAAAAASASSPPTSSSGWRRSRAILRERLGERREQGADARRAEPAHPCDGAVRRQRALGGRRPGQAVVVLQREGALAARLDAAPGRGLDRGCARSLI